MRSVIAHRTGCPHRNQTPSHSSHFCFNSERSSEGDNKKDEEDFEFSLKLETYNYTKTDTNLELVFIYLSALQSRNRSCIYLWGWMCQFSIVYIS